MPEKSTSPSLIGLTICSISLQGVEIIGSNHVLTARSWNALWYSSKLGKERPPFILVRCKVDNFNFGCLPFQRKVQIKESSRFHHFKRGGNGIMALRKLTLGNVFIFTIETLDCSDAGSVFHLSISLLSFLKTLSSFICTIYLREDWIKTPRQAIWYMLGIVVIWILSAFLFNGRRDDLDQLILYPENVPKQLNVSSMFWVVPKSEKYNKLPSA